MICARSNRSTTQLLGALAGLVLTAWLLAAGSRAEPLPTPAAESHFVDESALVKDYADALPNVDGSYLVVWSSAAAGIDARHVASSGVPIGPITNVAPAGARHHAVRLSHGDVAIAWTLGEPRELQVRFVDGVANPIGGPFPVEGLGGTVVLSSIAPLQESLLISAWATSPAPPFDSHDAFVTTLGLDGSQLTPFQHLTHVETSLEHLKVFSSRDESSVLLTWQESPSELLRFEIYDADDIGNAPGLMGQGLLGGANVLPTHVGAALPTESGWLVALEGFPVGGNRTRVYLQEVGAGGATSPPTQVSDAMPEFAERRARLSWAAAGDRILSVSWESFRSVAGGPNGAVFTYLGSAALFDRSLAQFGETAVFAVNDQEFPRALRPFPMAAMARTGKGLAVWTGDHPDNGRILARALEHGILFVDGFETGDLTAWSGPR